MSPLERLIRAEIAATGPMRLDRWMALCLGHPAHGYYTTRDPLGAGGDFTTAPEISQMFGELCGLWLRAMGCGPGALLVELGPGRGTLMADALRALGPDAPSPWLVETSPVLRERQAAALSGRAPRWADRVEDLPPDGPLFLIANEFFDALPIRQLHRRDGAWRERVALLTAEGRPALGLGPAVPWTEDAPDGAVREVSPGGEAVAAWIGARLARAGGAALVVDYGYDAPPAAGGDTLQALRAGRPADPAERPGEADLTAHVHFGALARAAAGARAHPLQTQGAWLERMGLSARAQALLAAAASPAAAEAIVAAHRRLAHPDAMGALFKVLMLTGPDAPPPPGLP